MRRSEPQLTRDIPTAETISEATAAWRELLGPDYVLVDPVALRSAQTTTFSSGNRLIAIVQPASSDQVQGCMRVATQFRVPVYPSSRGMNIGLGGRVPACDGCVLLDLRRMNRIAAFDEELGYLRVQAGVTFAQAHEFLSQRGSELMLDVTGGPPDASVVGNTVERGHGLALASDRFSHVCGLEVVLGDGSSVRTGFHRFEGTTNANLNRWGVGPSLDGLFTQSRLGIVTELTMWLQRKPRAFVSFWFTPSPTTGLAPVVDALRELKRLGLRASFRMLNDIRMLTIVEQYPWEEMDGATPLSDAVRRQRRSRFPWMAEWNGFGALYGSSLAALGAEIELVRELLEPVAETLLFFDRSPESARQRDLHGWSHYLIAALEDGFLGTPLNAGLQMCYWRKTTPRPRPPSEPDPEADGCGLIWVCPALPLRGQDAVHAEDIMTRVLLEHGFEPNIGFLMTTDRSIDVTVALLFDRDLPGEDERAAACERVLLRAMNAAGYPPYRLSINAMGELPPLTDDSDDIYRRLANALDPSGVLAPGRYEP
jgi:FAD/FMN-containing dehydrogenase